MTGNHQRRAALSTTFAHSEIHFDQSPVWRCRLAHPTLGSDGGGNTEPAEAQAMIRIDARSVNSDSP
jgi:hypothetical protein